MKIQLLLAGLFASSLVISAAVADTPDASLRVVIIRHAEKPDDGDNLSCKGMNRAMRLPAVLQAKFQTPSRIYVPTLESGKSTKHARMFQTITPFAAKYNLKINSEFDEKDTTNLAQDILKRTGTVLVVWEHSVIQDLGIALGATTSPAWDKDDFDKIWIVTFPGGTAKLSYDNEGIVPGDNCGF